jgi:hypothetical protein
MIPIITSPLIIGNSIDSLSAGPALQDMALRERRRVGIWLCFLSLPEILRTIRKMAEAYRFVLRKMLRNAAQLRIDREFAMPMAIHNALKLRELSRH